MTAPMTANGYVIAPQKLMEVRESMASELSFAFDVFYTHLAMRQDNPRQRAELREAKKILHNLKHPDFHTPVSEEEMGWALHTVIAACGDKSMACVAPIMRAVAAAFGINADAARAVPRDLDKKIGNAVKVLLHHQAGTELLAAAV